MGPVFVNHPVHEKTKVLRIKMKVICKIPQGCSCLHDRRTLLVIKSRGTNRDTNLKNLKR